MDALHSIAFYLFAAVAVAGAVGLVLTPSITAFSFVAPLRLWLALAVGIGVAGLLVSLSAGFAAIVSLVALVASALIGGGGDALAERGLGRARVTQASAVTAAVLFLLLAYVGFRVDFHAGAYPGGAFGSAALGRVLFEREAVAIQAVAAALLVCLVSAAGTGLSVARRR